MKTTASEATWTGFMKAARKAPKGKRVVGEGEMRAYSVWQDGRAATVYAESTERALQMPGVTGLV